MSDLLSSYPLREYADFLGVTIRELLLSAGQVMGVALAAQGGVWILTFSSLGAEADVCSAASIYLLRRIGDIDETRDRPAG